MKNLIRTCATVLGLAAATVTFAQKPAVVADSKPGWHRIAGLEADFTKDHESVHIMGNDEFAALRFRVEDAAIHIDKMQIFYESGDQEDLDVKSDFQKGETSKDLQLKHAGRDITRISFTYHTIQNDKSKKAELEIYGLKTDATAADSYDKKVDKAEGEIKETREEVREDAREAKKELKEDANETESAVERAAEKTGDEVSEAAAKTAAEIDDKRHETKVGPDGQVVYISDDNRFYYINEEGKKVFATELELKDK
jgi:hypothetical protein